MPASARGVTGTQQFSSGRGDKPRVFWLFVGGLTTLAALLVWYRIGADAFWLDENASIRYARTTAWTGLLSVDNGNMPLYLGLLKLWLWGADGEASIRLLSAIPFVLTVPVVALIGRRLRGDAMGVLAAAVVATHPMLVQYGQEARAFALVTLLVSAGALGLCAGVQDSNRTAMFAGVVSLAVAPYAHSVATLAGVALLAWALWLPPHTRPVSTRWIVGVYAVLVAPFAITLARGDPDQVFWIKQRFPVTGLSVAWHVVSDTAAGLIFAGFAIAGIVFAVLTVRRAGRTPASFLAGVPAVWIVGTGMLVAIIAVRQSLLVPRYLLLVVPAMALLVADTATRVSWSRFATALVVVAIAVNGAVVIARGAEYRPEQWRDAQAFVGSQARSADGIIFAPTHKSVSYDYYQERDDVNLPTPVLPQGAWGALPFSGSNPHRDAPRDVEAVADSLASHDRIWLVTAHGPGGAPDPKYRAAIQSELDAFGKPAGKWTFGDVTVVRYDANE